MEYLGHFISEKGVAPDHKKVEAIKEFPTPENLKVLWSFLGLALYYRCFIQGFSIVANPLLALTRQNAWRQACQEAFKRLKELLTTAPLLTYPDFT